MSMQALLSGLVITLVCPLGCAEPAVNAAKPPPIKAQHHDPDVDALLDRLERADAGIRDLSGDLIYTRVNVLLDDVQTRHGTLQFVVVPAAEGMQNTPRRVFRAHFTHFRDSFIMREEDEQWGFDGQWLFERNAHQKTLVIRQIAREGEALDPLRLGEGPLPIPLGQRKAEILARYDVSKRPLVEGLDSEEAQGFRQTLQLMNAPVQLHLHPLRGDEQFDEVRLWYGDDAQGRLLPILARAARFTGDGEETEVSYVMLFNTEINQGLTVDDVKVDPAPDDAGWRIERKLLDAGGSGQDDAPGQGAP